MESLCFNDLLTDPGGCCRMTATVHQLADVLGKAVDAKDKRLFAHSALTADLASVLAQAHGLAEEQAAAVHIAGHLHDVGKIGIPDAILFKEGPLDAREWEVIRRHPSIGAEILAPIECFGARNGVVEMVLSHHERFDGGGYPRGLKGLDIPLGGRILAIADSVAAMLEHRVYRPALPLEAACAQIALHAGEYYDPALSRRFLRCRDAVAQVLARHGETPPRGPRLMSGRPPAAEGRAETPGVAGGGW